MPEICWTAFDYADKATTAPPPAVPVWIREDDHMQGVTVGYFDGFTFRTWTGSDDCRVSWWADLNYPDDPGPGPEE